MTVDFGAVAAMLRNGLGRAMFASQTAYDPGREAAFLADALALIAGLRPVGAGYTPELAEQMENIALDALAHRDAEPAQTTPANPNTGTTHKEQG